MSKHTPGPWVAGYARHGIEIYSDDDNGGTGETVAMLFNENEANADLIKAAPDLLEALAFAQVIVDMNTPNGADHSALKALGLTELVDANGDPDFNAISERIRAAIAKATGGDE